LYDLLSINQNVNEKEIKNIYLIKVKELHPDRYRGDKNAEDLCKKVNQTYLI
jgi:DnaJ-class molecular chaperone